MNLPQSLYKNLRPSNSGAHYGKIKVGFHNLLHDLANAFNVFKATPRIELYIRKLIDADYTIAELERAVDHCMEQCKNFPSFPELSAIISNYSTKEEEIKEIEDEEHNKKAHQLFLNTQELSKIFIEKHGKEKLEKQLKIYCNCVFKTSNFGQYGFSPKTFLPLFFKDLMEAKTFYKAIQRGKKHEGKRD